MKRREQRNDTRSPAQRQIERQEGRERYKRTRRYHEMQGLITLMGSPADLQRSDGETFEAWCRRVGRAWENRSGRTGAAVNP